MPEQKDYDPWREQKDEAATLQQMVSAFFKDAIAILSDPDQSEEAKVAVKRMAADMQARAERWKAEFLLIQKSKGN